MGQRDEDATGRKTAGTGAGDAAGAARRRKEAARQDRPERLAAALRDNLRRRKAQSRYGEDTGDG